MRRITDNAATTVLVLAVLVLVGATIRVIVASQDLFADELATYWIVSTRGVRGLVDTVRTTAEITPPLSFVLSWLATRIDLSPELLRLPALIGGVASIPLLYAIGLRTVGRGAALLGAALMTFSPLMIFYSAEARAYGLMMALVLVSTLALLLAVDRGERRWWLLYAAAILAATLTHYTVVFVLATQFLWVLWTQPEARRAALASTAAAALLFTPWLPSMKGDLDSPTTAILGALSPFTLETVRTSLAQWSLGFPNLSSLVDSPGIPALALIAAGVAVGAVGLVSRRGRLGAWFGATDRRILLVGALALATPVGLLLASAVGPDVFSPRNLVVSWPYLALAAAALITVGDMRLRVAAAALAVAGFGLAAARVTATDHERPNYAQVAEFVADGPRGVLVDAAAVTPGPLTNFDVEGSEPGVDVFRLNVPEQKAVPFRLIDRPPDPSQLARRAVAAADGEPITIVVIAWNESSTPKPETGGVVGELVERLPPAYRLGERRVFEGFIDLEALVYERRAGP